MQIPSLPTDNLYKFASFGGLALIIAACVMPYSIFLRDAERMTEQSLTQTDKLLQLSDEAMRLLDEKAKSSVERLKSQLESENGKVGEINGAIVEQQIKLDAAFAEGRTEMFRLRTKLVESRAETLKIDREGRLKVAMTAYESSKNIFKTGVAVTVLGFMLWWWKVQRFHDRTIRAETELAEKELASQSTLKN